MDKCFCGNLKKKSEYFCKKCDRELKSNNPSFMPAITKEQVEILRKYEAGLLVEKENL